MVDGKEIAVSVGRKNGKKTLVDAESCSFCGKVLVIKDDCRGFAEDLLGDFIYYERFELRCGYGSDWDGTVFEFLICDDCIYKYGDSNLPEDAERYDKLTKEYRKLLSRINTVEEGGKGAG